MANKGCEGNCYPKMFSAGTWEYIKPELKVLYPEQNTYIKD